MSIDTIKKTLTKYHQTHLLQNYDKFDEQDKEKLINQIKQIDFDLIDKLYEKTKQDTKEQIQGLITPIPAIDFNKLDNKTKEKYKQLGIEVIKKEEFAVVTLAGGQGTRLGHNGPKGTFIVELKQPKSIFEIHVDTLKKANKEYDVCIPWYIMTSRENNEATVKFFEQNDYFNYPKNKIKFFVQPEIENILEDGTIILDKNGFIYKSSSGNGAVYQALYHNGILQEFKNNNIKWMYMVGIDNILANTVDPIMIGATLDNNYLLAAKSTMKDYWDEKVGVFAMKDNKPTVLEYFEISEEMAKEKDKDGNYIYGDSNLVSFLLSTELVETFLNRKPTYHISHKKINYLNKEGVYIIPEQPNAYKFETFNFDYFDTIDKMLVFRVKRDEEFAPIKNKEGKDSPETAIKLYEAKNK